jgi:hypothetical protein
VACLDARLPAGLLVSAPDVARELAGTVLRPVLGLHAVERDLLLTTLAAWLECDGSARRGGAPVLLDALQLCRPHCARTRRAVP